MRSIFINSLATVLVLSVAGSALGFSGAGSGTEEDPYIITDVNQLQEMQNSLSACYRLGNDINAVQTVDWPAGDGFLPVGDDAHGFTGHLDGNDFAIIGLFIDRGSTNTVGLFGKIDGATIEDVTLLDPNVTGAQQTGALAGYSYDSSIISCRITGGNVTGTDRVGGMVGYKREGSMVDCHSQTTVVGGIHTGGLVGRQELGSIEDCHYSGNTISGTAYVGGLLGSNNAGSLSHCTSEAHVFATSGYCGGLVGSCSPGPITDCHSKGTVFGNSEVGGLVGHLGGSGQDQGVTCTSEAMVTGTGNECGGLVGNLGWANVRDCWATGRVVGNNRVGGLVGFCSSSNGQTITNSYAMGNVEGYEDVGGLVGKAMRTTIGDSYSTGMVVGTTDVGGLVGYHYYIGSISRCFSAGDANGSGFDCGGFVGLSEAAISDCLSTGDVNGDGFVGGFVGETTDSATTANCYSIGRVSGGYNIGGFAGYSSGTCDYCFWDTQTSEIGVSACGLGRTTVQMKQQVTFDPPWNFSTIWGIDEGQSYPYLMKLSPTCGDPWHPYPVGDLNHDCKVDFLDIAIVCLHWLECTAPESD
jgi:hypothetical protein